MTGPTATDSSGTDSTGRAEQNRPEDASPLIDVVAGLLLAAMSLFALLWLIPNHTGAALSEHDISPGFFPTFAAWAVLALSVLFVATRAGALRSAAQTAGGLSIVIEIAVWSLAGALTVLGLSTVGFLIAAPILIAAWMIVGGRRAWWQLLLLALLFPLVIDQLAWIVFTVQLP